jgi:hypothetical protein
MGKINHEISSTTKVGRNQQHRQDKLTPSSEMSPIWQGNRWGWGEITKPAWYHILYRIYNAEHTKKHSNCVS